MSAVRSPPSARLLGPPARTTDQGVNLDARGDLAGAGTGPLRGEAVAAAVEGIRTQDLFAERSRLGSQGRLVGVAVDSTLFIDLARRRASALRKVDELDSRRDLKVIPTPVAYEILSGILETQSRTQASLFKGWMSKFHVPELDLA